MASKKIKSVNLLPEFFRTEKNSKFLSSTLDQIIQKPQLERLDSFFGSKLTPNYNAKTDSYVSEIFPLRRNYQLEPSLVVRDIENKIQDVISFDDLINELKIYGGDVSNFDRLFRTEHYSFNPFIDWDKFINYQEYYWLVSGPDTILITGQPLNTTSTYTVQDSEVAPSFVFTPDGSSTDPIITLYRGNTYNFNINSNHKFYIRTEPSLDPFTNYDIGVTNNGISNGIITFVVDEFTPSTLYYISEDDPSFQGQFVIKLADDDTFINVESEIIGKKNYTSENGIEFSNGIKIRFGGTVEPAQFRNKEYFVEGVGTAIKLIEFDLLSSPEGMADIYNDNFDAENFDYFPFDSFKDLPLDPEYLTINRASRDLNPWTRYNRWVHSAVIEASAKANNQLPVYPADKRAKRPIIEFAADLKLYNFGTTGIKNVDLIDTLTTDAFSQVEGTAGYHVDGVLLEQGHRVIFNADNDPDVQGKIYTVNYIILNNQKKLELIPAEDFSPVNFAAVTINLGNKNKGANWWFNGTKWIYAQQHFKLNEAPLFDLFDNEGQGFADLNYYTSDFKGNKIFGYSVGTGSNDAVLGFPLKYENSKGVGSFLFQNYILTDTFNVVNDNQITTSVDTAYLFVKFSTNNGDIFKNVWDVSDKHQIPILQFQTLSESTSSVIINSADLNIAKEYSVEAFVNSKKINANDYYVTATNKIFNVNFVNTLSANSNLLLKIKTDVQAIDPGFYETPLNLTNNPLNDTIKELTLSELSDHVNTMVDGIDKFIGKFPGSNNLRDISNVSQYGNRLISSSNPIVFASFFLGKKEHNLIDALNTAAEQYNQYKLSLFRYISEISDETDPVKILDIALKNLNVDKDVLAPYYLSDMIAYGTDRTVRSWVVTDIRNILYPISSAFNLNSLSTKSILVYLNGTQLVVGKDYQFLSAEESIQMIVDLTVGDEISVFDYYSTEGCFIPPTPTKLGLYPKYEPKIFEDTTYAFGPIKVIQGHDGSTVVAYNDYRDDVILEFEKRIYNNIKSQYRHELFDINSVIPGAFRNNEYSLEEINSIIQENFIKWAGYYSVDYEKNSTFDINNTRTWNYRDAFNQITNQSVNGNWRSAFKYFYDTDRPHSHPWEMLGFSIEPDWWVDEYGPAPYTAGNDILWTDIENGRIRQGDRAGINSLYVRTGLKDMLPVDEFGNLIDPTSILTNITPYNRRQNWVFGDQGPAETAWRKSSYWPFVVQKLLALTKPATYSSLMYDTSRLQKNIAGQWTYGKNNKFLSLKDVVIQEDKSTLTSGYSVYVVEVGKQRSGSYIDELKSNINFCDVNLFYKVGGFVSKNKVQLIIDAYDPLSTSPGAILPQEDYELILNVSNPVNSIGISGIILQKSGGKFVIKGYNTSKPYFTVFQPLRSPTTPTITVGGVSSPYIKWSNTVTGGNTGLSSADLTTANQSLTSRYYQEGQIVLYGDNFYVVKVSHRATDTFNPAYYQILPELPIKGGATVQIEQSFEKIEKRIPYGTEFSNIQDVYDVIIGYGEWLKSQGFIFDQFNSDLNEVLDWKYTGKEFLYWTTQNWADNSLISLSPFADQIKYQFTDSIVDNIFNSFYEYSVLQVNGTPVPQNNISVNREDGICTISTLNAAQGIYFAQINSVQKEHGIVFKNKTIFNDTVYDIETGYKQKRIKIVGFRTRDWDGDYFSPGFIYDIASIKNWTKYTDYKYGDVVKYAGKYYSAKKNVTGSEVFDFNLWVLLGDKPVADLLPNFDYKINQFEDFYSLDIDNFDNAQQQMAQHLIGYTPRVYLNNIFTNPIAQYKFYQGFIKEKGTRNSVSKLAKATIHNLNGKLDFTEEWAFRIGQYGSYSTFNEIEIPLKEGTFIENPQIINFVDSKLDVPNDLIYYQLENEILIKPIDFKSSATFVTQSNTFQNENFQLLTAGYPRLDDVTYTVFNEAEIIDLAAIVKFKEGDTIWVGFKDNSEWDVLRYESIAPNVVSARSVSNNELLLTTKNYHNLSIGNLISIVQFDEKINGIYVIKSIPALDQFIIDIDIPGVNISENTAGAGLLFIFNSIRFNNFDELPSDQQILKFNYGTKLWVDNDLDDKWAVYEKIKNYKQKFTKFSSDPLGQQLGYSIHKRNNNNVVVIGSPNYNENNKYGRVFVYKDIDNNLSLKLLYTLNENKNYTSVSTSTEFGYSVFYDDKIYQDTNYGLLFAGAPGASYVKSNSPSGGVRYSTGTETASSLNQQGVVKISSVDPVLVEEVSEFVLVSPYESNFERFGSSLFVERNTSTKLLLVGAPSTPTTATGAVYAYSVESASTGSLTVSAYTTGILVTSTFVLSTGSQWGYSISGSDDAQVIAISAPGYDKDTGLVQIFNKTDFVETLFVPEEIDKKSRFGEKVLVSYDGLDIFVSAPNIKNTDQSYGKVYFYQRATSTGTFTLVQTISNPVVGIGMTFGRDIDINYDKNLLTISALGTNNYVETSFDYYSLPSSIQYVNDPESDLNNDFTTFDSKSTTFHDVLEKTGTVYLYDNKYSKFVLADEIKSKTLSSGDNFGYSLKIDNQAIYVGVPSISNSNNASGFYKFSSIDNQVSGWKKLRYQEPLVDINLIQRSFLFDAEKEEIINYLDIIDPIKGKIAGLADQEMRYKSVFDPAVYTIGNENTVNDETSNWLDEHVGDLWWDLSTVKYFWYEQGDLTYRRNTWGKTFPGSTIDVYEWVKSRYLPSEWMELADTVQGLAENISGEPKYTDDSVVSRKQIMNSVSGELVTYYYFWVKNKVTVPDIKNRRLSSFQVSKLIEDPTSYGLQFLEIISKNAFAAANIGSLLVDDKIHLNLSYDLINNSIPKHTEWLLLEEGNATSVPNTLLEKKLLDSLLGHDKLGNLVPDPQLSFREKYGINIRPRQTMFKNRAEALRNLIEYVNGILIKQQVTGNYSFKNLNKQENIPSYVLNEYDLLVEDIESLNPEIINTSLLSTAKLTAKVKNGKIHSVTIDHPGFGYLRPPTVKITSDVESNAVITTNIDSFGRVTSVNIVNAGEQFNSDPLLEVRPFTVIVQSDINSEGKWAKYVFDIDNWSRIGTQKYNTPIYWDYVDWVSDNFNQFVDYTYTINEVYQLEQLTDLGKGQYIKIKNSGDGHFIIVERIDPTVIGTFSLGFDLVYSEKGTIQIKNSIWDFSNRNYGYDQNSSFDETLYDQTPDIELEYILTALKEDLFINELKIYWNLFFFKAVKYALSEQKLLDWAFKTSFINVKNLAGELDQRPVYKLQNSSYYEDYLKEVKPYHSVIRNFTTNYTKVDPSQTHVTDFDLPSIYDSNSGQFISPENTSSIEKYPWKSWNDNYKSSIGSISIADGGEGYTAIPTVTISAVTGDTGSGAVGKAYIRSGKVIAIEITNPGSGYTQPPNVIISNGGPNVTTNARAYANLLNEKTRKNKITMRFDRISKTVPEINNIVTDEFICNGVDSEFVLSWLAKFDKLSTVVTLNGSLVLSEDYKIEYYTREHNGYNKKFSKIVFSSKIPDSGKILQVRYIKDIVTLNAVERILTYYTATSGMPGIDLSQLMSGIEYPGTQLQTLAFDYTTKWDVSYRPYGQFAYADDILNYAKFVIESTATTGSSVISLTTTTGIVAGQRANIISYTTNQFNTSSEILVLAVTGTNVTFSSSLSNTVYPGDEIEIWAYDSNSTILDSLIEGGTWSTLSVNAPIGALGVNPEDIVINGEGFFTPNNIYAPEEYVPGNVLDSVGINVYTKSPNGAPLVFSGDIDIIAGEVTTAELSIRPAGSTYITVMFNNINFEYVDTTSFTSIDQFTINWATNEIIVPAQTQSGKLGYTILGIGGGKSTTEAGVIDSSYVTVSNTTTAKVVSLTSINSVKSAYVTVNGAAIPLATTPLDYGYVIVQENSRSKRAAVVVYNLPSGVQTVQAWFFANAYKYFNEVREEIFTVSTTPESLFTLAYPPGNIEPAVANIIVEVSDNIGRRRLLPPSISYYEVSSSINTTFLIDNKITRPPGTFGIANTKVYLNGRTLRPGFDYTVSSANGTVTISSALLSVRDVVAVFGLIPGEYDYNLVGSTLVLSSAITDTTLKVITFNDHDDMVIRTERFVGSPIKRYKISRPVLNDRYVWVMVNGIVLTSGLDFEMLDDQVTVQISDAFTHTTDDEVVIMSISSEKLSSTVLGYRIFNDLFNRTHFKRLSKKNTTYLINPLLFTDTEIYVADAEALTPPIPSKKIPGIILIDGERIEFNQIDGNVLKQLRRATLGTAPSFYSQIGTKVIDQGVNQTIPYSENFYKQTQFTTSTTNTYVISTVSNQIIGDGITLSTLTNAADQIQVFYGGRILRKFGVYHQDISMSFDSPVFNIKGTTSTVSMLPTNPALNDAYVVSDTNKVWVYTKSLDINAFNGYVYQGLNYLEPEFTVNTSTQSIILNLHEGVSDNIKLVVLKKDFLRNSVWNDEITDSLTKSLLDSTTIQAKFLQAQPAELPDKYYYGDLYLTNGGESPLLTDDDLPLEEG